MIRILAVALLSTAFAAAQQPVAPAVQQANLAKLDESSARFTSAQATFRKENFTYAVKDTDTQNGITYTIRGKDGSEVGIKIIGPGARTVVYKDGTAKDYTPGTNCYNAYSAAKSKGTIESLLTLSFGASGKDLSAAWEVTDLGPETIDNTKIEKLSLIPKDAGLKNNITKVELWTDLSRAVALKQVVYTPSRDTQTAYYANIKLGGKVDTAPFKIEGKPCGK
jgi:outer membrane lipoprotein-sorting protein